MSEVEPGKNYVIKREGEDDENYVTVWVSLALTDPTKKFVSISITDDSEDAGIDFDLEQAIELRNVLNDCIAYVEANPPECVRCHQVRHRGGCVINQQKEEVSRDG